MIVADYCEAILFSLHSHSSMEFCIDIVAGSFCTETFTHFIKGLLNNMQPYPAPNSMVVMDNCNIHKHPNIWNLIEARLGALIMYISWTDHHIEECVVNSCRLTLLIST